MSEWKWNIPAQFNIGAACTDAQVARGFGDRIAMIVEDAALGETRIRYAELAEQSSRFAAALSTRGIAPQTRVLVRLPNSLAYPVSFFGAMKAGCIAVPSSTLLSASEMAYLAQDSGAEVLVAHVAMWPELKEKLEEVGAQRAARSAVLERAARGPDAAGRAGGHPRR
jgi:acyl-coenzyme A synthetase/AMP-(fatty) acid ligase